MDTPAPNTDNEKLLMQELEKGKDSGALLSEDDAYLILFGDDTHSK